MWRTLTLLFLMMNLLGFGVPQSASPSDTANSSSSADPSTSVPASPSAANPSSSTPANPPVSGDSSVPAGSSTSAEPSRPTISFPTPATNKTTCIQPRPILSPLGRVAVLKMFNSIRGNLTTIRTANRGACASNKFHWDQNLEKSATFVGLECPLPEDMDHSVQFEPSGAYGQITWFAMSEGEKDESLPTDKALLDPIVNIKEDEYSSIIKSYKRGPWDPGFQILWDETDVIGCVFVKFNNSDLAWLSKFFKKTITETMELQNLVCHFFPPGCRAGEEPWPYVCPKSTEPPVTTTTRRTVPTQFSSAKRIGAETGFNFETLCISYILIGNIVRVLSQNLILY